MSDERDIYVSPLARRYASSEMSAFFSDNFKFTTWRRLWLALAESEAELGLEITSEQLDEMRQFVDNINYDEAAERERLVRHDVMAHVHAYGLQAPKAAPIIHLGATSCFVTDNADLIQMREGLRLLRARAVNVLDCLARFAGKYSSLPTLGFTHYQPAQPTTVGKRACLWMQELLLDIERLDHLAEVLPMRGVKGATGTQASFLDLFDGDGAKVDKLQKLVCDKMGFDRALSVTGQTYTRKIDYSVAAVLSGVAQSAHKFANDLRLLANLKEMEEPFEPTQIGSSAMAYKRNPMRAERMTALARFVITLAPAAAQTAAEQWLERTLDDSAARRLYIPEAFLATDGILQLYQNIVEGLVVYPETIRRRLEAELPFMATEAILMAAVASGGDRQKLHERIRQHSQAAGQLVKAEGKPNDLLERIKADPAFKSVCGNIDSITSAERFTGRASEQVRRFLDEDVAPILDQHEKLHGTEGKVEV